MPNYRIAPATPDLTPDDVVWLYHARELTDAQFQALLALRLSEADGHLAHEAMDAAIAALVEKDGFHRQDAPVAVLYDPKLWLADNLGEPIAAEPPPEAAAFSATYAAVAAGDRRQVPDLSTSIEAQFNRLHDGDYDVPVYDGMSKEQQDFADRALADGLAYGIAIATIHFRTRLEMGYTPDMIEAALRANRDELVFAFLEHLQEDRAAAATPPGHVKPHLAVVKSEPPPEEESPS